jgi:hypothetical protein
VVNFKTICCILPVLVTLVRSRIVLLTTVDVFFYSTVALALKFTR